MSVNLRQYQTSIIDECRSLMISGNKSILIQSPTGSGKTLLTAYMLKTAASKGMDCWFLVHRRELIKQSIDTFSKLNFQFGVISAGWFEQLHHKVQIASVQSLSRRIKRLRKPSLIIFDEAHHCPSKTWDRIHKSYPDAYHIGLTATPQRLDGKGLGNWFQQMINGPTVEWLIENKFLSPYKIYAPPSINTSDLHTRMGDFVKSELQSAIDKPTITGDAIKHYQKLANGKRAVCFCVSIEHSKHVVSQFISAGIKAEHVDGETPKELRDQAIERFKRNETQVISNVDLFGEGFDLPALEVAILLRPTQSLGLYLQQVGRALRTYEGKSHAIILDHAGNCERHGLPDEEREWSLQDKEKRSSGDKQATTIKVCKKCFAAQEIGSVVCKYCGYEFEKQSREVDEVDGELQELDLELIRRKKKFEQSQAKDKESLIALGKSRGYKKPHAWAEYVLRARGIKYGRKTDNGQDNAGAVKTRESAV